MAYRRFAADRSTEAIAVRGTFIKRLAIAAASMAAAACLTGCATPQPFSVEEKIWFDKAVGHDIIQVQPSLPYPPSEYALPPQYRPY
jgi:hypothetical protein